MLDAKRDLGAKGDGTDALQKGLDQKGPTKVLFLPNGTYRVTKSPVVNGALGPWLYGETRDGVVIRLADGSLGVYGLRELAFGGDCLRVKVREKRGAETRTLGDDKEGGWIGWAAYHGWAAPKK